jgi:outer membrane biosynthesis protein TonB
MPSSIPAGHRRLAAVAGLVLAVGLTLTGCDPTVKDTTVPAGAVATTAAATPAAPPAPAPATTTAEPAPAPSPSATTAPAPAPVETVAPATPKPPAPAPAATTAKPPATKAPVPAPAPTKTVEAPHTTSAPAPAPAGNCEIVSNAGNCYKAGQFCRNDDLGRSTHDAGGRLIYCRMVSGKPHWQA